MTQRQIVLSIAAIFCSAGCSDSPQGAVPNPSGVEDAIGSGDIVDVVQSPDVVKDVEFITDTGTTGGSPETFDPDGGEEPEEDVGPVEGGFLWPCQSNADCDSGFCVFSSEGYVCSKLCIDDCPDQWMCKEVVALGDPVFICQPSTANLCRPCQADADCAFGTADQPNLCLQLGTAGQFCALDCTNQGCPDDFLCSTIPQPDGTVAKQCIPQAGECPCLADYDGLTTQCVRENVHGTCEGERQCDGATGVWTECTAKAPEAEVCDNDDNDCDGFVDNNLPPEPCEVSNDAGICQGQITCSAGTTSCDAKTPTTEFCDLVDNDCDGLTDEDLGETVCGTGTCQSVIPNCLNGQQNICDPLLGNAPEICDGNDNDCDGSTDELDDLGTTTCGLGECLHTVANCVGGVPVSCDPFEGQTAELCDGLDNDCNDLTDETWPEKGTPCDGTDPDECKTGEWTCSQDGAGVVCAGDDENFVELCDGQDNDCDGATDEGLGETTCGVGICLHSEPNCVGGSPNTCDPFAGQQATDIPDLSFEDTNCDGVDGDASKAVFVDVVAGSDANNGTKNSPVKSLSKALTLSSSGGKNQILISQGTYSGAVTLKAGVSLYGGYDRENDWARSSNNTTILTGATTVVTGNNISVLTVLELLTITSGGNSSTSGSSVGVWLKNSGGVVLAACDITAGTGGPGSAGTGGSNGTAGSTGGNGQPGCEDGGGAWGLYCSSCNAPSVGVGSNGPCGGKGGNGGSSGKGDGSGSNGSTGNGGALGGAGGAKGKNGKAGGAGAPGASGSDGAAGQNFGTLTSSGYTPANGLNGSSGSTGKGGGGGGGGGGDDPGFGECKSYGGTGGGGGSGGCGGSYGRRGTGGGGSFAVIVYGGSPTLTGCTLATNTGGTGGAGGGGGNGGTGGNGGNGGSGGDEDATSGGKGGKGGNGGKGGDGGGGGGGPSIGVLCGNGASPAMNGLTYNIGSGGTGGSSPGLNGKTGQSLNKKNCN